MKKSVFLTTHLGSDYHSLFNIMNKNPRVQGNILNKPYSHPSTVEVLTSAPHKLKNSAAIYMDVLLHNYMFSCPTLYKSSKFIYLVREARPSLNQILTLGYKQDSAFRYYCYRLRRICEMAKRTPSAVAITHNALISGKFSNIEKYLNLKEPLIGEFESVSVEDKIDSSLASKAQECYERHFYFLKKSNIEFVV